MLGKYVFPHRRSLALLALLFSGVAAISVASPHVLRVFMDTVSGHGAPEGLARIALLYVLLAIAGRAFDAYGRYFSESIAWHSTNALRADLFSRCLYANSAFHKSHSPGELVERIDGDVLALNNLFSRLIGGVAVNSLLLLSILIALLWVSPLVAACMLLFCLITLKLLWGMHNVASSRWAQFRKKSAEFFGSLLEWLSASEDICANGAVPYVMSRFHVMLRGWYPTLRDAGRVRFSMMATSLALFSAGVAASLASAAGLYEKGAISIGTVYLVLAYAELIRMPLENLRVDLQEFQRAAGSISRVEELLALDAQAYNRSIASTVPEWTGWTTDNSPEEVAFDRVSFSYDGDENALSAISLTIPPGKVLGVLGRTGSGKTTLARLLQGLYRPTSGELRIGGRSAWAGDMWCGAGHIGVVPQDVYIFNASLRDNLTLFDSSPDDSTLLYALSKVGLSRWVLSLERGLDTVITASCAGLSGGEAQLLAFARVLLINSPIVVLDEVSSRLDPVTLSNIESAMDTVLRDRTGVIIAHRLSTVMRADYILILDHGRVVEFGAREDLISNSGSRFNTLLNLGNAEALS